MANLRPSLSEWQRLLPVEDYRFRVGVRQGNPQRFFAPPSDSAELLAQRHQTLDQQSQNYVAARPEARSLVLEAVEHMTRWRPVETIDLQGDALALCIAAARCIEADWVILSPDAAQHHPVMAGAVCFPSSWSLPAKLGQPIFGVHEPVPGLNQSLGGSIDTFLTRLSPAVFWERENWGLSADDRLDHHLSKPPAELGEHATLATTWLRWERQLLTRLPATRAILFGIKISIHRLDELATLPVAADGLARALRTMPEDIAQYKGLTRCRQVLAELLQK